MHTDVYITNAHMQFFVWAKKVTGSLESQGHWADYIDPCSGLPVRMCGLGWYTGVCVSNVLLVCCVWVFVGGCGCGCGCGGGCGCGCGVVGGGCSVCAYCV